MRLSATSILYISILMLLLCFPVLAQDDIDIIDDFLPTSYALGDKFFSVHLGGTIPLANYDPSESDFKDSNLSFGGSGYLEFSTFLNSHIAVGLNAGISVMGTVAGESLLLVPVGLTGTWVFQIDPFDIPVFIRSGLNFTKRGPELFAGPFLQSGTGVYWNMDSSWAFGIRGTYTWVPLFSNDSSKSHMNRFGNFFEIHLGVIHHF